MADIRINSLPTTASASSSDDFLALDGATNGTRKLNAYSPTFGGNLTVSGTASVTGQINGSAGYQFRGATGTTYELLRYVGGTNNPGIFTTVNESTKKVTIFASGSLVSGQTLGLGAEGSEALTLGAANATLAGNITVSGTGASSVGGTLAVSNGGNAARAAYVNTGSSTVGGYMLVGNAPNVQPERSAIIGQYAVLNADHTMFGRNLVPVPNADTMKTLASVAYGAFLIRNNGAFEWLNNSTSTAGAAITPTSRMTLDTSGNLTVSGKGDFQKSLTTITTESDYAVRIIPSSDDGGLYLGANSTISVIQAIDPNTTWDRNISVQPNGGKFLIGKTIDSTNGKLQLADHNTSAGGIGFGTETSLYRIDTGALALDHVGGSAPRFVLRSNGTIASNLEVSSGDLFFDNRGVGKSLYLRTTTSGGTTTTALTLDSSQNATFAGKITANGASVVSTLSASGTTVTGFDVTNSAAAAINNATRVIFRNNNSFSGAFVSGEIKSVTPAANNTSNLVFSAYEKDNGLLTALTLTPSGTSVSASFNGAISINNTVNTVSPTSPNRTITMVIGGTTYYIHAKTTND